MEMEMKKKKAKTSSCNWCRENQQEIKGLKKKIKGLHARILELQQELDSCSCADPHGQQTHIVKTEPCFNNKDNNNGSSIISSTTTTIKTEKVGPEEESLSDAGGPNIKIEPAESEQQQQQSLNKLIIKQEKLEPMLSDDDDQEPESTNNKEDKKSDPPSTPSSNFRYYCIKHFKCSASFSSFPPMLQHLVEVHGWKKKKKEYVPFCATCGQLFKTNDARKKHCRVQHGVACNLCSGNFRSETSYLRHMKYEHKSVPTATVHCCSECGAKAESKAELISHIIKTHGFTTDKEQRQLIWTCPPCKSHFLSQGELGEHDLIKHRHECRNCGAIFTVHHDLTKHRIAEHGLNPPSLRQGPPRPPGQGISKANKKRLRNIKKREKKAKKQQYREKANK